MEEIIELPETDVVCFKGFNPDSEVKAFGKMKDWLKLNQLENQPRRIFGHNIESNGERSYSANPAGYKVLVTLDKKQHQFTETETEVIKPGKFLSLLVEGDFETDGEWIMQGWLQMNEIVRDKNYKVKSDKPRWFEEHLKPSESDKFRLNLLLEIE